MEELKRLNVELTKEQHTKIKLLAVQSDCSMSDIIRGFIEEMLTKSVASWIVIKTDEKA